MWTCPKCGRNFNRQGQSHYCGKAPLSVNEYIAIQDIAYQKQLTDLVALLRASAPDAVESIKWSMPCFENGSRAIQLSACKKQISLYVGADVIDRHRSHLKEIQCKKDALYFPYEKPLPIEAISTIIRDIFADR